MSIRKISEFVEASSPQNSDKLLLERNGSGKSITVGNLLNDVTTRTRVNLLRSSMPTKTSYGITCTNNGDGTFTINGTAIGNVVFILAYVGRMSGYKLTGCPTNNSGSYLAILRGSIDAWSNVIKDAGNGAEVSLDTTSNPVVIGIEQGLTLDNVVFKPMITNDLSATYDDFVSYDDSLVTGINSGIKLDLLWANEDPYAPFAEQTINIDYSNYKLLIITWCPNAGNVHNLITYLFVVGVLENRVSLSYYYNTSTLSRGIKLNDANIYFGEGSENSASNNDALVPYGIYGVR